MDEDSYNLNLKSLEEMVLDEEILVTYIYASKRLCIHVNDSKILLKALVDKCRESKKNVKINVNYLISGLYDNNNACTLVCSEENINNDKQSLKKVFYEHIYSISKGLSKVDKVIHTSVDSFLDFPLCTGLIKSKTCIKHSLSELKDCKLHSHENSLKKLQIKSENNVSKTIKQEPMEVDKLKTCGRKSPEKNISDLNGIKSDPIVPKKNASLPSQTKKPQKGIVGFFNKQSGQVKKEDENKAVSQKAIIGIKETIKEDEGIKKKQKVIKNDIIENDKTNSTEEKALEKSELVKKESSNIKKSVTKSMKKTAKIDKKRKRVLHVSDSESDDEQNNPFENEETPKETIESEDEIPPTPTVNTVKVTSGIVNPKKKRKIVDKTYTDEDGYILTRKEEVYESCSDNEEVVTVIKENINKINETKKEVSPNEKKSTKSNKQNKKVLSPQKGKQTTLMSFFKKAP